VRQRDERNAAIDRDKASTRQAPASIAHMRRLGLAFVRYGLPLAIAIAGIVCLLAGGNAAGAGVVLLGSAAMVLLINVLFRLSLVSNREREQEELAREQFEREGRWPDE
jgi:hypothetical protein